MPYSTEFHSNQKPGSVPFGTTVFKSLIVLFFGYAVSYYLFNYLFDNMLDLLRESDIIFRDTSLIHPGIMKVKFSLTIGVTLSLPFIACFILSYRSPQLYYSKRKRFFLLSMSVCILTCVIAILKVNLFMPFILGYTEQFMPPDITVISTSLSRIISYSFRFMMLTGFFIALPVTSHILVKANILNTFRLSRLFKYVIIAAFIVAAISTPPDPVSMIIAAVSFIILYQISKFSTRIV